jgi:hypothetical protein
MRVEQKKQTKQPARVKETTTKAITRKEEVEIKQKTSVLSCSFFYLCWKGSSM